ncbi:TPA: TniQ family protein [Pseudomonas putida]|nr:TniQ family protein [Pseudomonas putida]
MTRTNQSFARLLKPVVDESISGWIARGQHSKEPCLFFEAEDALCKFGATDADGDRSGSLRKRLAQIFGINDLLFDYLFFDYGAWLMHPPELRVCMCEFCLIEDFSNYRRPTTRSTWAYSWFNICPVHGQLISDLGSTVPSQAIANVLNHYMGPTPRLLSRSIQRPLAIRKHKMIGSRVFKTLSMMAFYFQEWYISALKEGIVRMPGTKATVALTDFEIFMSDLIAIIGKKRSYPYHQKSYIARLLDIKGECSLSVRLSPSAGPEACLCFDANEHPPEVRMTMFALLGLFIGVTHCVRRWHQGEDFHIRRDNLDRLWWGMHSEVGVNLGYLEWLQNRSRNWNMAIKERYSHLLEDWWQNKRPKS